MPSLVAPPVFVFIIVPRLTKAPRALGLDELLAMGAAVSNVSCVKRFVLDALGYCRRDGVDRPERGHSCLPVSRSRLWIKLADRNVRAPAVAVSRCARLGKPASPRLLASLRDALSCGAAFRWSFAPLPANDHRLPAVNPSGWEERQWCGLACNLAPLIGKAAEPGAGNLWKRQHARPEAVHALV